jgi:two-component sensor histidine kinase/CheY-like chemotaxis protein
MADMLAEILAMSGEYEVCGIARTVDKAVELGRRHNPDLAILDIQLADGGLGMEIPPRLKHLRRLGVLYASGHIGEMGLTRADGNACLSKPYKNEDIIRALEIVKEIVSTGEASPPYPQGFHVLNGSSRSATTPKSGNSEVSETRRLRLQQAALAKFGTFALVESDLGAVLTEAARVCAEGMGVLFCKVCRYRAEEDDLLVEAGVGWRRGVIGRVISQADETSPQGRAFISGDPVICRDLTKDASFVLPSFYAEHGIISTVDVIIRKEGQPYGVLEVCSPVQYDYDQHDIAFLTAFANILAEAVNTSKRNAQLQAAFARMRDMVGDRDRLLAAKSDLLDEKSRLLEDKSVLARELQHRVRNNLHLVYGMLRKQLQITTDADGKEGIGAIARRVMTLSQVYEHLLGTGMSRTIDFGGYLSSLCSSFETLELARHPNVELTCHCEPIVLDLDTVTAIGLAVSELIANSYGHAFPNGAGAINVTLSASEYANATIVFADDGIGFTDTGEGKRQGLRLVKRLMEQIGGSAALHSNHGTEWTLKFPVPTRSLVVTSMPTL